MNNNTRKENLAPESDVKYSKIREIAEKVDKKNKDLPEGEKVINLSIGQNFIGNPQPVFEKIDWFTQSEFKEPIFYAPSLGPEEVREKIGTQFYPFFYDIPQDYYSANEVMITDGAFGAGRNALGAIMTKGDILVVDRFTFRYFINTLQIFGRGDGIKPRVETLPSKKENGFVASPEKIKGFLTSLKEEYPDRKIVYYTQFGFNPTGHFRSEKELKEIANFIGSESKFFLVNDIAYHLLRWEKRDEIPLATFLAEEKEGIVDIDTLSKPFGLMGARVGCLITKDQTSFRSSARVQQYSIVSPNKFAIDIWNVIGSHITELAKEIKTLNMQLKKRKQTLEAKLKKRGLESIPAKGSLYSFVRTPKKASKIWKTLIDEARVAGVPGTAFTGEEDAKGENYLRFTIALPEETIKEASKRLANYFPK